MDNPFDIKTDRESFQSFIEENQVVIASSILAISFIISTFILRDRIIEVFRKSEKEKAIDYIDKARKLSKEESE